MRQRSIFHHTLDCLRPAYTSSVISTYPLYTGLKMGIFTKIEVELFIIGEFKEVAILTNFILNLNNDALIINWKLMMFLYRVASVSWYQNIKISGYIWGVFGPQNISEWAVKEFPDHSMPSINDLSDGTHFVTDQTHFAGGHSPRSLVSHLGRQWGGMEIVLWCSETCKKNSKYWEIQNKVLQFCPKKEKKIFHGPEFSPPNIYSQEISVFSSIYHLHAFFCALSKNFWYGLRSHTNDKNEKIR